MSAIEHKIVVLGAGGVGKSALCIRFTSEKWMEKYDPTIEDSYRRQFEVDGYARMLDILDTAGQDEYTAMRSQYMRTGQGFIIVYAVDDETSFEEAIKIYEQLIKTKETEKVPVVLAGNKCDLEEAHRQVTTKEGEDKATEWGIPFLETSAKIPVNVDEMFRFLVRKITEQLGGEVQEEVAAPSESNPQSSQAPPPASVTKPVAPVKPAPKKKGFCNIL